MNTKLLMTISAFVMMAAGVGLTFLPSEVQSLFSPAENYRELDLILQVTGALYFGFGMINWTARANLIGGIYSRPVAIGNLSHFMIGGLALLKGYMATRNPVILSPMFVYLIFGLAFGYVFFTHPIAKKAT